MTQIDIRIQDVRSPLGRIALGGHLREHTGTPLARDWLVRGAYSLACVTRGSGKYIDVFGRTETLNTGDLILVFPEIGHRYGPEGAAKWDECFAIFEGPLFDLWRAVGLLSPAEPIIRLGSAATDWCTNATAQMEALQVHETVANFQNLATALLEPFSRSRPKTDQPEWMFRVRTRLEQLDQGVEVEELAAEVGLASRTVRRQFLRSTGMTPQQYRDERRLRVALELLTHVPGIKLRAVALRLGFADEYYFSRWFKRKAGVPPSAWRQQPLP